jgi:cytochrome c peroxidase
VFNAALMTSFFWTGAAQTLEEQAEGPLSEMGLGDPEEVVKRIAAIPGYSSQFAAIYGDQVSLATLTNALAEYERTLTTSGSPYERFVNGDTSAMSGNAVSGLALFNSLGCASCHSGENFAGPALAQGQGFFQKFPVYPDDAYEAAYHFSDDLGRNSITQADADKNVWRVPTLRNIAVTAPYFHNGAVKSLDEAVRVMAKMQLGVVLSDEQAQALVAFLDSLTGVLPKQTMPVLPPLPPLTSYPEPVLTVPQP